MATLTYGESVAVPELLELIYILVAVVVGVVLFELFELILSINCVPESEEVCATVV